MIIYVYWNGNLVQLVRSAQISWREQGETAVVYKTSLKNLEVPRPLLNRMTHDCSKLGNNFSLVHRHVAFQSRLNVIF